jgi:hypothetical protein
MAKPRIRHADLFLQCSEPEHKHCPAMRDALMEKFSNVTMAYITKTDMEVDYCVAASAIVKDGEINSFRKALQNLKGKGKEKFNVSKVKLYVSTN